LSEDQIMLRDLRQCVIKRAPGCRRKYDVVEGSPRNDGFDRAATAHAEKTRD
jgi:hypothetical protein